MPPHTLLFRLTCLVALMVWVGGFMFYGAAVVPALHDALDSFTAGFITRRVTDRLNAVGAVALVLWGAAGWSERRPGLRAAWYGLLATSAGLLVALFVLHGVMDDRLDAGRLRGFYPLHRVYLVVSTVQWLVNLGLLAVALRAWSGESSSCDGFAAGASAHYPAGQSEGGH
jgi:hypothetical protein